MHARSRPDRRPLQHVTHARVEAGIRKREAAFDVGGAFTKRFSGLAVRFVGLNALGTLTVK
jgi:hypothetical protein